MNLRIKLAALTITVVAGASGLAQGPAFSWVNQKEGPRPRLVWENREDIIYHDLAYGDKGVEGAPEFAPFMGRGWVFNRAMQWHRELEGILCYSSPATLWLTGTNETDPGTRSSGTCRSVTIPFG
jgi:hypothetical protein